MSDGEKEVAVQGEFAPTGTRSEEGFASGEIIIENKRTIEVSLPKGFKLVQGEGPIADQPFRDKNIFALDNDIVIPAEQSITTTITAVRKGQRGDIPPGPLYFTSMSQWSRERILPRNEKPLTGGLTEKKMMLAEDQETAKTELIKQAKKEAIEYYSSQLSSDKLCMESLSYVDISEMKTSVAPNELADTFQAELKGTIKVMIIPTEEIKNAMKGELKRQFSDFELVSTDDSTYKFEIGPANITEGKAEATVTLGGTFAPKFTSELFEKSNLMGFNENALRQRYAQNPAIDKIEVNFFPFWRKTIPPLEDHVFIEIVK